MATIVNARDVILQAYSPRVATVSMSPNLVVSQDQVTGLGLVVAGTKMLFLSATTQVFQIAKSGTVSPASTVLTAELKNITNSPTLSVVSGTITPTPVLAANTVTIPYANMLTDTALLRLTAVQDGVTYTDEITIVKVREGIDGLMGFLSNEAHTRSADYLGNVLAYTGANGNFKVFQGINDITSLCTYSIPTGGNTNALTATINATTGAYTVTGGYPTNVDLAVLLFRATFGTATLDKVFTVAKTKAGAPGTNGTNGSAGTNGVRGSRTFYVTLTGSTATYSDSLATTTATVGGGPVLNDTVTQYNTSQGFSQTKFYTAGGWVVVNAVVDGNLLVSGTVGATQMQTNVMNADNTLTRGLTVRDTSGNIILSSGVPLPFARVAGTTNGKIDASNITTFIAGAAIGNAQIGGAISSDNYAAGSAGWIINKNGAAEFNTGTFRGALAAATGTFAGALSAATGTFSGQVAGGYFTTGGFTGYAWPANGSGGSYLGPEGLLLGNSNVGTYFQVEASGNIYSPAFDTINGVMNLKQLNVVNTVNIAGNAVSSTVSASGSSETVSTSIYVPANQTMRIMAFLNVIDMGAQLYVDGIYAGAVGAGYAGGSSCTFSQSDVAGGGSGRYVTISGVSPGATGYKVILALGTLR